MLNASAANQRPIFTLMAPLMLVMFISALDQTVVATALAGLGRALGRASAAPWIATAYLLTSAAVRTASISPAARWACWSLRPRC